MSGLGDIGLGDIIVQDAPLGDMPVTDERGNTISIEHGDGSISITVDGEPIELNQEEKAPKGWFDNLVDDIDRDERARIAEDLLRGVRDDLESRRDWIEDRANGIKLLGLKIEIPGLQGASDGAPVEGMSKVRHPLLLEAVVRFWANATAELLPADGPVKVRNDDTQATSAEDQQADDLAIDLNHYLTDIAKEYYPDTSRMIFKTGFDGLGVKKVYFCPLRMRPVSESVSADDVIVSNEATSLGSAKRVTHRIMMAPSTVKRMQILGVYRDVELPTPMAQNLDSLKREEAAQQGIKPEASNPLDRDREIYEIYCEQNIKGFEHKHKGKASGLEIPYKVTIDVSSREILEVVRNYDENTKDLPEPREVFIAFILIPGLGFYPIGLLHLLGNTTNAITASWRIMLDSGMYANFPGFLIAKSGTRQNTSIVRVPPGAGGTVDTGGKPIQQAVMPLPYQTTGMAALMNLVTNMEEAGQRVGMTSELQVGEGRADVPVGTALANIEQAVKVMMASHKGLCKSQAEEFALIVKCFREHPESFYDRQCDWPSGQKWCAENFGEAIKNCKLVPQADPNTASNAQRMMKVLALKQLAAANPSMYNPIAIDTAAIRSIGFSNPQQFFAPPEAQSQPPPELQRMLGQMQNEAKDAQARLMVAQARVEEIKAKIQGGHFNAPQEQQRPDQIELLNSLSRYIDSQTKAKSLHLQSAQARTEDINRDQDRASKENIAILDLIRELLGKGMDAKQAEKEAVQIEKKTEKPG